MGFGAKSLGRKQFSRNKAKGLWLISAEGSGIVGRIFNNIVSTDDFGDPILEVTGSFFLSVNYLTTYQATFASPSQTTNILKFGNTKVSTSNILNESVFHTESGGCSSMPKLTIQGSVFTELDASARFGVDIDTFSGFGNTVCERKVNLQILVKVNGGVVNAQSREIDGLFFKAQKIS